MLTDFQNSVTRKLIITFPTTSQTRRYISREILISGKQQQPETYAD